MGLGGGGGACMRQGSFVPRQQALKSPDAPEQN